MKNKRRQSSKIPRRDIPRVGTAARLRRWYASKAPLLHFGMKFCALAILFYLLLLTPFCKSMVTAFTVADARLSGVILNLIGQHNHVDGVTLLSGDKSVISVESTCSGFDFLSFFCAAVLVFPAPFMKKLPGVLVGIILLLALNLVRIMSLYFVGVHYPGVFDLFHEEIWAVILIGASIVLYVAWMKWAGTPNHRLLDATA